jgi:hypothetical protein
MMATGELASKLSKQRRVTASGAHFLTGYAQTTNKQAEAQEFDGGRVHKTVQQHMHKIAGFGRQAERAKCSRTPEDLWAFTKAYRANPRARRRALARSIEEVFGSSVRFAVKRNGAFVYTPSLKTVTLRLKRVSLNYVRAIGR